MTQYNSNDSALKKYNDDLLWTSSERFLVAEPLFVWIISVVEVPVMLLTLFALCSLIKSHYTASVYVMHLILSDLIQMISLIVSEVTRKIEPWNAHKYSLIVGLYFMACIAFERYVLVAHPIWYRTHHSLKLSSCISLIIWFVPLIFARIDSGKLYFNILSRSIALLIPYPIIILCFVGTWRGLSHSISLTSQKRKLILGSLFLVLLNYTLLILPYITISYCISIMPGWLLGNIFMYKGIQFLHCLMYLNPLADCLLYLFMRTDAADIMKSLYCCGRSDTHQISVRYISTNTPHDNVQ